MGNSGSSAVSSGGSSGTCKSCNTCSQKGLYFGFGKKTDVKFYAIVKGKQRRVYTTHKGRFYKEGSKLVKLPPGIQTFKEPKKVTAPKRKVPKKGPKKVVKVPKRKVVKDSKNKKIGTRLSARAIFNEKGMKAVGRSYSILQKDGTRKMKVLRLRKNGSPYFANKFGNTYGNNYSYNYFGNRHLMHNNKTFGQHIVPCEANGLTHQNIPFNKNWLRGSPMDNMTGLRNSWPVQLLPPAGVAQPRSMSILPRMRRTSFGA